MQVSGYFDSIKRSGYKLKEFKFPSGKIVKVQGYENIALDELLKTFNEDDIVTDNTDIEKLIGKIMWKDDSGKFHRYYPDIYVKTNNTIYEIKSNWVLNSEIDKNIKKKNSSISNGVNFLFMVYDENNKNWKYAQ